MWEASVTVRSEASCKGVYPPARQGWGRLQKPDYDYDYDYSAHKIIDYDYDYDYSGD